MNGNGDINKETCADTDQYGQPISKDKIDSLHELICSLGADVPCEEIERVAYEFEDMCNPENVRFATTIAAAVGSVIKEADALVDARDTGDGSAMGRHMLMIIRIVTNVSRLSYTLGRCIKEPVK